MKIEAIKKWAISNKKHLIFSLIVFIIFLLFTLIFSFKVGIVILILSIISYSLEMKYHISNKVIESFKDPIKRKKIKRITIKTIIIGFFAIFLIVLILVCGFCYYIVTHAPDFNPDALYSVEPTIIYDKYGNEIDRIGAEQRITLEYEELPEVLINAIIATEDSQFFQHNGVDIKRFLMASALQLSGTDAGGASTLTMQLSKKNYTSDNKTGAAGIIRKFTDVYISVFKIEPTYTKQDIITFYVNSNYLGGGYGVEQTSLTYFGKSAKDLNLAEAAMIAGLFQAPGKYNPYTNPEGTETRRQNVLKLMLRHGYIDQTEYDIAKEMTVDKIVKSGGANEQVSEYQSFIDQVTYEVAQKTGKDPAEVSMKIYTTMDPEKQRYVTSIMNGESFTWENDVVKAGIAIVDVHTGEIVALGGGRNINSRKTLNYATRIKRQIGSTAKPLFDYAPAIEFNGWSSAQPLTDEAIKYNDGTILRNWDRQYYGYRTMRMALAESRNTTALKAFRSVDKAKLIAFVQSLGLHPELINGELYEAHSTGGYGGESPLTMASAYATFANGGYYITPYSFYKVEFSDGTEYKNIPVKNKVMSEDTAYIMTSMLIDTAKNALGGWSNINGQEYGAKTGTSNYDDNFLANQGLYGISVLKDLWVVGFNTDYSIGLWYGYDEFNHDYYQAGSTDVHARLFNTVASGFFNNNQTFNQPDGVVSVDVEYECPVPSLVSDYTPAHLVRTELFIKGTEPTVVSERFDKLKDISNLEVDNSGTTVTLTWNAAKLPMAKNQEALKEYYKQAYETEDGLNSHLYAINEFNNNLFGEFGYNVYEKDKDGNLKLIKFTTDTEITIKNQTGNKTYVIKTAYEKFPDNMSDGKSISIQLEEASIDVNKNNFIKQLYKYCLNKTADDKDLEKWYEYESSSLIAYNICTSDSKVYDNYKEDLNAIYNGILGRNYKEDEFIDLKEIYDESRNDVIKEIINSSDFKTYCTNKKLVYTEIK